MTGLVTMVTVLAMSSSPGRARWDDTGLHVLLPADGRTWTLVGAEYLGPEATVVAPSGAAGELAWVTFERLLPEDAASFILKSGTESPSLVEFFHPVTLVLDEPSLPLVRYGRVRFRVKVEAETWPDGGVPVVARLLCPGVPMRWARATVESSSPVATFELEVAGCMGKMPAHENFGDRIEVFAEGSSLSLPVVVTAVEDVVWRARTRAPRGLTTLIDVWVRDRETGRPVAGKIIRIGSDDGYDEVETDAYGMATGMHSPTDVRGLEFLSYEVGSWSWFEEQYSWVHGDREPGWTRQPAYYDKPRDTPSEPAALAPRAHTEINVSNRSDGVVVRVVGAAGTPRLARLIVTVGTLRSAPTTPTCIPALPTVAPRGIWGFHSGTRRRDLILGWAWALAHLVDLWITEGQQLQTLGDPWGRPVQLVDPQTLDSAERATAPKPAASGEISAAETIHLVRSAGLDARFGTNDDLEVTWYPAERRARPELNAGDICHGSLPYAYPVVSPASCPAALDAEHTNTLTTVDGVATWAIKAAPGAWLEVWGATLDGDPIYWLGPVPSVSPAP